MSDRSLTSFVREILVDDFSLFSLGSGPIEVQQEATC